MDTLIIAESDYVKLRALPPTEALLQELERAVVVAADALPRDVVTMHSKVLYVDETTGRRGYVRIVYPAEADARAGRVSVLAPVGAALLGLSVGQAIEWEFPDGGRRRLRVEDLVEGPAADRIHDALAA